MATASILIIVTFLAGNAWGPQVSTQIFPNPEICKEVMNAVAGSIIGAAKSNVTGEVIIEKDSVGGLNIITGVNRRIMAGLTCKPV